MKKLSVIALLLAVMASTFVLSACQDEKQKLGLVPTAPDEFSVVHRAPLSMPPDFTLRPPRPGAPSPQDVETADAARTAIVGHGTASARLTPGDSALLHDTGADTTDSGIRTLVDSESAKADPKQKPVAKRLLGWTGIGNDPNAPPAANVVNPEQEAARLQHDQSTGQPPTAGGPTPNVEN